MLTLDALIAKRNFYYNTLAVDSDQELNDIFQACCCRFFTAYMEKRKRAGCDIPSPISIVSAFCAGGITAANVQWIKSGFSVSKEEMAECQQNLLSKLLP